MGVEKTYHLPSLVTINNKTLVGMKTRQNKVLVHWRWNQTGPKKIKSNVPGKLELCKLSLVQDKG